MRRALFIGCTQSAGWPNVASLPAAGRSRAEVEETIAHGETIENYRDDKPYPSRLVLANVKGWPLHVVVAWNAADRESIVVTVYEPDPSEWDEEFKRRKP